MSRPIRLLTFSTLFPNRAQPNHGVFVENRLRHLVASGDATSVVLAPVPIWPWRSVPAEERRHGIRVLHPRFLSVPGFGLATAPSGLFRAARTALRALVAQGFAFDMIDAHYLYPDGVVALRLGALFDKPVVLTARGSDVSQLPDHRAAGPAIRQALARADALIAVSAGLKDGLVALGAASGGVTVLRNGVDLVAFQPAPSRLAAKLELGLGPCPALLSVGHLIERKGHHHIIAALPLLPRYRLLIAGEGPDLAVLQSLARRLGVADRVRFLGPVPHTALPSLYSAADALVLASSREGWANVLLEAMACGTPVVASPAWGNREAVAAPEAGIVLDSTTPDVLAAGIQRLFANLPDRAATRAYAEGFGWDATSQGQLSLFRSVLSRRSLPC